MESIEEFQGLIVQYKSRPREYHLDDIYAAAARAAKQVATWPAWKRGISILDDVD